MKGEDRHLGPLGQVPGDEPTRRLESWKEIADYLRRGVTTVQRWEHEEGLPIRRHDHTKKGSVYAYTRELDQWREKRERAPRSDVEEQHAQREDTSPPAAGSRRTVAVTAAVCIVTAVVALTVAGRIWLGRDRATSSAPGTSEAPRIRPPRPLANEPEIEENASLSPDGRHVVYRWRREEAGPGLFIKNLDSAQVRRLTGGSGPIGPDTDDYPAWSPSGDNIAFLRGRHNQRRDLMLISPFGGTPERKVTDADGISVSWAPDGRNIAFADRVSPGEPVAVFLLSLDTGLRVRLTSPRLGSFGDTLCAVSPDGRSVAFARFDDTSAADIYVMPIGGGEPRRMTMDASPVHSVTWTPDGEGIVFSSYRDSGSRTRLWYVSAGPDPARPTLVAGPEGGSLSATFARASGRPSRLVYTHGWFDVNIWQLKIGKEQQTTAVANSTAYDSHPAISPDGTRIAFASNRTGAGEIWVSAADGSNARRLTSLGGPQVISPRWSPDGRRLVFSVETASGGRGDIYVINADGTGMRRFTSDESNESRPSWSVDGHWIYFTSNRTGIDHIWRAPADGSGQPVDVTKSEAIEGYESEDGRALYFIRSYRRGGIMRMSLNGDPPVLIVPGVERETWTVTKTGIVYLSLHDVVSTERPRVKLFDTTLQSVRDLGQLPLRRDRIIGGLAVSPDGRMVFWAQLDAELADLMVVDEWVRPVPTP
jgi:Tol biopolymer transport system component